MVVAQAADYVNGLVLVDGVVGVVMNAAASSAAIVAAAMIAQAAASLAIATLAIRVQAAAAVAVVMHPMAVLGSSPRSIGSIAGCAIRAADGGGVKI